jgi:hypothetical protein
MSQKYLIAFRPASRRKLKTVPGAARVGSPSAAESELGLKAGDVLAVTDTRAQASRKISGIVDKNAGQIAKIQRVELTPVESTADLRFDSSGSKPMRFGKRGRGRKPRLVRSRASKR